MFSQHDVEDSEVSEIREPTHFTTLGLRRGTCERLVQLPLTRLHFGSMLSHYLGPVACFQDLFIFRQATLKIDVD